MISENQVIRLLLTLICSVLNKPVSLSLHEDFHRCRLFHVATQVALGKPPPEERSFRL